MPTGVTQAVAYGERRSSFERVLQLLLPRPVRGLGVEFTGPSGNSPMGRSTRGGEYLFVPGTTGLAVISDDVTG
jgi:hypothetical protein